MALFGDTYYVSHRLFLINSCCDTRVVQMRAIQFMLIFSPKRTLFFPLFIPSTYFVCFDKRMYFTSQNKAKKYIWYEKQTNYKRAWSYKGTKLWICIDDYYAHYSNRLKYFSLFLVCILFYLRFDVLIAASSRNAVWFVFLVWMFFVAVIFALSLFFYSCLCIQLFIY